MTRSLKLRYTTIALLGLLLLFTTGVIGGWIHFGNDYSITRRVVGIPYERALSDYCEVLKGLDGVTDVEYKDFESYEGTALVTVHYNPEVTSPKILMVWLGNTKSIWEKPVIA